MSVSVRMRSSW
jgi:D-alanyl-D-alanine carboxypeptidase